MISELKKCSTVYDLADILEIPAKTLTYLLYVLPNDKKYKEFCISKKNGGARIIHAPEPRLKHLQQNLSDVLYECQYDLKARYGPTRSFGFEKDLWIYDNSINHIKKRWVFNVDIKDFFHEINFGRVISFFKYNKNFNLNPKIATLIAQICCYDAVHPNGKSVLPQGAPTSPVISNLICGSLDYRLSKFASYHRCNYSRYADDITFSTNLEEFPSEIAIRSECPEGWVAADELVKRVDESGFQLNPKKTRMSHRSSRQIVTGLVVNKKVSAPRDVYKSSRAAVHAMMSAKPAHLQTFCTPYTENCAQDSSQNAIVFSQSEIFDKIQGRLAHCFRVNDLSDLRTEKKKFFEPTAVRSTYSDLLRLKYFVRPDAPIILTEGISDSLYLKSAIQTSQNSIPALLDIDQNGNLIPLIKFYRFKSGPSRILSLSGGSGNLSLFLERHHDFLNRLSKNVKKKTLSHIA